MEAPGGKELLNDRVARMYPFDDTVDIPEPGTAVSGLIEMCFIRKN